jgi:hypothetical protein
MIKSTSQLCYPATGSFRGKGQYKPVILPELFYDLFHHIMFGKSVHGRSSQPAKKESKWRPEKFLFP